MVLVGRTSAHQLFTSSTSTNRQRTALETAPARPPSHQRARLRARSCMHVHSHQTNDLAHLGAETAVSGGWTLCEVITTASSYGLGQPAAGAAPQRHRHMWPEPAARACLGNEPRPRGGPLPQPPGQWRRAVTAPGAQRRIPHPCRPGRQPHHMAAQGPCPPFESTHSQSRSYLPGPVACRHKSNALT